MSSMFVVVGYDRSGEEICRGEVKAADSFEACRIAAHPQQPAGAEEFQAVSRKISNDEIISRDYHQLDAADVCVTCGRAGEGFWYLNEATHPEAQCLQCVHAALNHGRQHVPEAFEEELLPVCNYCQTTGHLAADCPEQPAEDPDACPGCGCVPGDGVTAGCTHPTGCGAFSPDDCRYCGGDHDGPCELAPVKDGAL